MFRLDAATVLAQWAAGGLAFLWFTTRRREVGLGYGWLLRGVYAAIGAVAVVAGLRYGSVPAREVFTALMAAAAVAVLGISVARRGAGVSGHRAAYDRRSARVAAMTGIERAGRDGGSEPGADVDHDPAERGDVAVAAARSATPGEFSPWLDLLAPLLAVPGLVAAGIDAAAGGGVGAQTLSVGRVLVGAAFLGCVTDAMLLGHWYLTQPGLPRRLLNEMVGALGWLWPAEVVALVLPTGMVSVLTGSVDDHWGGMLGWIWVACAVTTIVLVAVTRAALRERAYSAVMAATGLLYLAILTAFGTDLIARAVLSG